MAQNTPDLSSAVAKLPIMVAREKIGDYLGGVYTPKYMARLDAEGKGPKRLRIGRKIAYRSEDLVEWLEANARELI